MKIKYEVYNPTGNKTALILSNINKECLHLDLQNNFKK